MDARLQSAANEFGTHLADWRRLLGLTARQVADRADISPKTLSRLENGHPVASDTVLAVARALGILDRLLDGIDPWTTDLGRLRSRESLPKRVRHRD